MLIIIKGNKIVIGLLLFCFGLLSTFVNITTAAVIAKTNNIITVSKQNKNADFDTITAALASVPDNKEEYEIEIDSGIYEEQLIIERSAPVIFRGKINNNNHDEIISKTSSYKDNTVTLAWNQSTGDAYAGKSDEDTSVVVVKTNGFRAYNINFNQTFGLGFDGPQAVAVTVDADQTVFDQCLFTSYQDTLFVGNTTWTGRQYYFKESYIAGAVDFIFGNSSTYFDKCIIASNGPGHISAQKRQFHYEDMKIPSAMIFNECQLITDWNTNGVDIKGKQDLGRPWRKYAKVIYMNPYIGDHIKPEGWGDWYSSTLGDYSNVEYLEFNNSGPGSWEMNVEARESVNYTRLIDYQKAKQYNLKEWYSSDLSWLV
ncbi:hypothetical protein INT45_005851 [Circinella minor]|uniref:Pectinesterase n=1 Tax=Circinella minor TaxID=1195481 RepID=A0A8H7S046_9FUNG|nr:hypothetical protein INT45_005851 [Circinella minor]